MASTIFDVTPEELEASASKVEGKTNEFNKAYNSIYTAVSDLRVTIKAMRVTLLISESKAIGMISLLPKKR